MRCWSRRPGSLEVQPRTLLSAFERIAAELTKLRAAEAALTSIVESVPLEASGLLHPSRGIEGGGRRAGLVRAGRPAWGPRPAGELRQRGAEGPPRQRWPAGPVACRDRRTAAGRRAEHPQYLPEYDGDGWRGCPERRLVHRPGGIGEESEAEADPTDEPSADEEAHHDIEAAE